MQLPMPRSGVRIAGAICALGTALIPLSGFPQTTGTASAAPGAMLVRVASSNGARTVTASESFAVERRSDTEAELDVIGPDGSTKKMSGKIENGAIVTPVTDQMLTCYNLALMTQQKVRGASGPTQIALDASYSGIPIPLSVEAVALPKSGSPLDSSIALAGESDGEVVSRTTGASIRTMVSFEGRIAVRDGTLQGAVFTISTFAGTPLRAVGGTTCEIGSPAATSTGATADT